MSQALLIPGLGRLNLQRLLFEGGIVGGIWDWSDRSTMFQDLAGTQPITASGQTRALHLDKSRGLVLGSQQVTNGEFVGDTTGWISTGSATVSHDPANAAIVDITGAGGGILDNQVFSLTPGRMYQYDVVIKAGTFPGQLAAQIAGNTIFLITLSGDYVKHSGFFFAATADPALRLVRNAADTGTVFINSISVRELPGNHRYQPNLSNRPQYIEDETGHYGLYDGVDDWDETNAVDFTGTDKMTVWWGGRKFNTTGSVNIIELSSNWNVNANSFFFFGPDGVAQFASGSRGGASVSGGQIAQTTSAVYAAPISVVATMSHDISGDLSSMRLNGLQVATATGDKGAGNFGNHKLFFGRRGGVSNAANIREYMTIIRGAQTPTNIIERVEREVRRKIKGLTW